MLDLCIGTGAIRGGMGAMAKRMVAEMCPLRPGVSGLVGTSVSCLFPVPTIPSWSLKVHAMTRLPGTYSVYLSGSVVFHTHATLSAVAFGCAAQGVFM